MTIDRHSVLVNQIDLIKK